MTNRGTLPDVLPVGLLVGGEWIQASSAGTMAHINPATGDVQRTFPVAGPREVDAAVAAARHAFSEFKRWSPIERRQALLRIAALLRAHAEEFAQISTLECGHIVPVASNIAAGAATWFEYYAGWTDKLNGEVISGASGFDYTLLEPYGVVAIVLTWNGPTGSIGMKVAAALAAGCSVVLKPSELAPFSSILFGSLCVEAGLPAGTVNVIPGGAETGEALVGHAGIDKISFTGGVGAARHIQRICVENLTPLLLELGGKSASIVFDDANVDRAIELAAQGISALSGQICRAPSRLLVQQSVYEKVAEGVSARLGSLKVGDPLDPSTAMGPVISEQACDRIIGAMERAEQNGESEVLLAGRRLGGELERGYYVSPAVFGDVDPASDLAQQEVFGPILSIHRFDDEEQAIDIANGTPFGLNAYVHTTDLARGHRIAAALDAGSIAINEGSGNAGPYGPFGGFKLSGHGKEGGYEGLLEYVRVKNVNIA